MPETDLPLDELRRVAEAAYWDGWTWMPDEHTVARADVDVCTVVHPADTRYIAAFDPPTALALLDRIAELEARVARVEKVRRQWGACSDPDCDATACRSARDLAAALEGSA